MFFWNSLAFLIIQQMLAIWSLVPLPFLNPAWTSGSSRTVEASPFFLWRPTIPSRTNTPKSCFFHYRGMESKVGSQEIPEVTGKSGLGMRNEAGQRLTEFYQENALVIANTLFQQHKRRLHMDIIRWSTQKSDWLYSLQTKMEKLYTVSKNKTRSWLWLRSWTPYCQIQTEIEESRESR